MKQDERSVVREAQRHAQHDLLHEGHIRPAVFMLVQNNPQTGARLSRPAAIGNVIEDALEPEDHAAWLDDIRTEARRLAAVAVALCVEAEAELQPGAEAELQPGAEAELQPGAEAELQPGQTAGARRLRVALIHVEDQQGLEVLHAPIDRTGVGTRLGAFVAMSGDEARVAVGIDPPLLSSP